MTVISGVAPGVTGALCLGKPAQRTPGHDRVNTEDQHGSYGTQHWSVHSSLRRLGCQPRGRRRQGGPPGYR